MTEEEWLEHAGRPPRSSATAARVIVVLKAFRAGSRLITLSKLAAIVGHRGDDIGLSW
jgi:hypothetical protein